MKLICMFIAMGFLFAGCRTTAPDASEVKKDYRDQRVKNYPSSRVIDISECDGNSFLWMMKKKVFPAIWEEAENSQTSKIQGVRAGHGIEVRLTNDITTFHVAFPRSRQGGRSFGAVGRNSAGGGYSYWDYVADASYSFYFDSLEKSFTYTPDQLPQFYRTILGFLLQCDVSGFAELNKYYQRVAADFVAVYIAEQYRNFVGSWGDRIRERDWDNAHIQTTLLGALHAGQGSRKAMYYEKKFTPDTYDTWDCVYYKFNDRGNARRRPMRMRDYTQANRTCKRSGVGQTRKDWKFLTRDLGYYFSDTQQSRKVEELFGSRSGNNAIEKVANYITENDHTGSISRAGQKVEAIVAYLEMVQGDARDFTNDKLGFEFEADEGFEGGVETAGDPDGLEHGPNFSDSKFGSNSNPGSDPDAYESDDSWVEEYYREHPDQ